MKSSNADNLKEFNSFRLIGEPRVARALSRWVLAILAILLIAIWMPWTQNIRSTGQVTTFNPSDRPQTVNSTIAGRIEEWYVQEGEYVNKGDTILTLSEVNEQYFDPNLLVRLSEQILAKEGALEANSEKVIALQEQIKALRAGLVFSLEKARNKIKQAQLKVESDSMDMVAAQVDFEIATVQFERQEKLYLQGLKSLTEYETRKLKLQEMTAKLMSSRNKFQTSKNELLNSRIELNSLQADYQDKISKAESELKTTVAYVSESRGEISKLNNSYANLEIRSSFYVIQAPQAGYIVKALRSGIGETIKQGEAVVTVMPDDPKLAVALYVRPIDLPLLEVGRKVRIQFDGWPALVFSGWPNTSFGTFGGKVAVIDNIDSQGKYRILVVPDEEEDHWPEAIRVGSGAYGWALLNEVPIWYELWRQFNGFPPDYMNDTTATPEMYYQTQTQGGSS